MTPPSPIWSEEERARRLAVAKQKDGLDALGKLVGCALGLVFLVLLVAGMGAIVVKLWRMAVL